MFEGPGVDNTEVVGLRSGLVTAAFHIVILVYRVEDGTVNAWGKLNGVENLIILSTHKLNHPEVIPVGNDHFVLVGKENQGVWLTESGDAMKVFAIEIENFNGLVVLSRKKQTLALEIQPEMVEIAREPRQRGRCHQL